MIVVQMYRIAAVIASLSNNKIVCIFLKFTWVHMSVVLVRDMMEYMGFLVSYDDDQDWYEFWHFLDVFITVIRVDIDQVEVDNVERLCVWVCSTTEEHFHHLE